MTMLKKSLIFIIFIISLLFLVFSEDKIINNEVINHTVSDQFDDENFPDYSILLQIDITKNSSIYNSSGSDFVIVDETGIPKSGGININIPTDEHLMQKISFLGRQLSLKMRKNKP